MSKSPALVIAQLSDLHLFAEVEQQLMGVVTFDALQAVLEHLQALQPQPDILLLTGDLSHDETQASYECLQDLLALLKIPVYWLAGNHDSLPLMQQVL
ncbi:MAG TPA: metallophosphoesterase, partial [Candidatus Caenarcaniphilales bacterium]